MLGGRPSSLPDLIEIVFEVKPMSLQRLKNLNEALSFLKGELSEGMTLAKLVLGEIDFTQGQLFGWMPVATDQDAIENFQWSPRLSGDEEQDFCRFVQAFIQDAHCAVILQDTENWNFEGDKYEALAAKYDDELYWYIAGADLSEEDVMNLTGMPILPYPWCGFFYIGASATRKPRLTEIDLQEIVKTLVGVAVGAFDHRSYVLWWGDRRPLPVNRSSN
jgi:hypothetical protein